MSLGHSLRVSEEEIILKKVKYYNFQCISYTNFFKRLILKNVPEALVKIFTCKFTLVFFAEFTKNCHWELVFSCIEETIKDQLLLKEITHKCWIWDLNYTLVCFT